jgi:hypothetical protein
MRFVIDHVIRLNRLNLSILLLQYKNAFIITLLYNFILYTIYLPCYGTNNYLIILFNSFTLRTCESILGLWLRTLICQLCRGWQSQEPKDRQGWGQLAGN